MGECQQVWMNPHTFTASSCGEKTERIEGDRFVCAACAQRLADYQSQIVAARVHGPDDPIPPRVVPAPRLVDGEPLCDPAACLSWHKNQHFADGEVGEGCQLHPPCTGIGDVCVPGLRAQRDQAQSDVRRLRFEAVRESVTDVLLAALTNGEE